MRVKLTIYTIMNEGTSNTSVRLLRPHSAYTLCTTITDSRQCQIGAAKVSNCKTIVHKLLHLTTRCIRTPPRVAISYNCRVVNIMVNCINVDYTPLLLECLQLEKGCDKSFLWEIGKTLTWVERPAADRPLSSAGLDLAFRP